MNEVEVRPGTEPASSAPFTPLPSLEYAILRQLRRSECVSDVPAKLRDSCAESWLLVGGTSRSCATHKLKAAQVLCLRYHVMYTRIHLRRIANNIRKNICKTNGFLLASHESHTRDVGSFPSIATLSVPSPERMMVHHANLTSVEMRPPRIPHTVLCKRPRPTSFVFGLPTDISYLNPGTCWYLAYPDIWDCPMAAQHYRAITAKCHNDLQLGNQNRSDFGSSQIPTVMGTEIETRLDSRRGCDGRLYTCTLVEVTLLPGSQTGFDKSLAQWTEDDEGEPLDCWRKMDDKPPRYMWSWYKLHCTGVDALTWLMTRLRSSLGFLFRYFRFAVKG